MTFAADRKPSLIDNASDQRFLQALYVGRTTPVVPCRVTAPLRLRSPMPRFRLVEATA